MSSTTTAAPRHFWCVAVHGCVTLNACAISAHTLIFMLYSCFCPIRLRAETKPREHRTPLLPSQAAELLADGHRVTVERFADRCIPDAEYEAVGCTLAEPQSWREAPRDAVVVGLKELPENDDSPLEHQHLFFGHCYKQQGGWAELLHRFSAGGGVLHDMEFLVDDNGRRVAAFGRSAGAVGMLVGLQTFCHQRLHADQPQLPPLEQQRDLPSFAAVVREQMCEVLGAERYPRVCVIGALGRCGGGAVDAALLAGAWLLCSLSLSLSLSLSVRSIYVSSLFFDGGGGWQGGGRGKERVRKRHARICHSIIST